MTEIAVNYRAEIEVKELVSSADFILRVNQQWLPFLQESGFDDFQAIWQCREGEVIKERPGLEIRRIELADPHDSGRQEALFIKKHEQKESQAEQSEGLKEFSNYCDFRSRGLATAVPIAAGMARDIAGQVRSFLITRDFAPFVDLEEVVLNQPESLQGMENGGRKKKILRAVARYARDMHNAGCNQKDFNATHVLLAGLDEDHPQVALFDLQRVDSNPLMAFRWPIKALAEFFFTLPSSLFDEEDRRFFFTAYKGTGKASLYSRLQYAWILRKMARIARHTKKRNLAPKMRE
ncbi:MAG: lipopolysaccharide kinase InaA family protein [Thermodesulfobacteriota bacterium]